MLNSIQVFNSDDFGEIRTVTINGEPWFVGKDIADVLGYSNSRDALSRHVDDDDKLTSEIPTAGQMREQTIINESGLYSLVLSSKLPTAKKFKRWVTSEVLPSIRASGGYIAGQENMTESEIIANALIVANSVIEKMRSKTRELETAVAAKDQQIAELQPKASYYDLVLNCRDAVAISVIAKDFGWSAKKMNAFLHEKKIQYKQGKIWLLYQKYAQMGYTLTKTDTFNGKDGMPHSSVRTCWTQKGRLFIYDLMKKEGIVPEIEKT